MLSNAQVIDQIQIVSPESLYKKNRLISKRKTDTGKRYCDIVAQYLINHNDFFDTIQTIDRVESYYTKSHRVLSPKEHEKIHNKRRQEEWIARSFLYQTLDLHDFIGTFIDYQVPIKKKQSDKAGKIDLLSYNNAHNKFYLIEFKQEDSTEPVLRAILEAYTYCKQINHDKLRKDYCNIVTKKLAKCDQPHDGIDVMDADVRPAVLIYDNSIQKEEAEKYPDIIKLADVLNVKMVLLSKHSTPPSMDRLYNIQKTHVPGSSSVWH